MNTYVERGGLKHLLKGQCHESFDSGFFCELSVIFLVAPFRFFLENSWICCKRWLYRWQIIRHFRREQCESQERCYQRWCWLTAVNFPLVSMWLNDAGGRNTSTCTVNKFVNFGVKIKMTLRELSGARGKMIHEKAWSKKSRDNVSLIRLMLYRCSCRCHSCTTFAESLLLKRPLFTKYLV